MPYVNQKDVVHCCFSTFFFCFWFFLFFFVWCFFRGMELIRPPEIFHPPVPDFLDQKVR